MRKGTFAALLIGTFAVSGAGSSAEPRKPETAAGAGLHDAALKMVQEGIDRMKVDGLAGLFELAFAPGKSVNSNPADRSLATGNMQRLHDAMVARYGKSSGEFELIRKEVIGTSLVRFTYLEKLEYTPVVWKFAFYRVAGEWKWRDVGVSDNLEPEYRLER